MTDDVDRAQRIEAFDRDVALSNQLARIAASMTPRDVSVDGFCIDCGDQIGRARLDAMRGCTSRCATCAARYEGTDRRGA
jgi:RNA polymerase-binding transcription factor DksA